MTWKTVVFVNLLIISVHSKRKRPVTGVENCGDSGTKNYGDNDEPQWSQDCEDAASIVMNPDFAPIQPRRAMNVSLRMQIINIDSVDPITETVNVGFNLELSWIDERLNYEDTNCTMPIMIDRLDSIWYPFFMITNAANDMDFGSIKERSAIIDPTGLVRWPLLLYTSIACSMDITYFPFDIQACAIGIASPTTFNEVFAEGYAMIFPFANFSLDFFGTPQREAIEKQFNPVEFYSEAIQLSLWDVTGKASFYLITLILPSLVVSMLMATTFTADAADEEKLSIAVTGLLSYFMLLSTISTQIPANSETTPYLLYFFVILLLSGTIVTFVAAFIRNLAFKAQLLESRRYERLANLFNLVSLCVYSAITVITYTTFFSALKIIQDREHSISLGGLKDESPCTPTDLKIVFS